MTSWKDAKSWADDDAKIANRIKMSRNRVARTRRARNCVCHTINHAMMWLRCVNSKDDSMTLGRQSQGFWPVGRERVETKCRRRLCHLWLYQRPASTHTSLCQVRFGEIASVKRLTQMSRNAIGGEQCEWQAQKNTGPAVEDAVDLMLDPCEVVLGPDEVGLDAGAELRAVQVEVDIASIREGERWYSRARKSTAEVDAVRVDEGTAVRYPALCGHTLYTHPSGGRGPIPAA